MCILIASKSMKVMTMKAHWLSSTKSQKAYSMRPLAQNLIHHFGREAKNWRGQALGLSKSSRVRYTLSISSSNLCRSSSSLESEGDGCVICTELRVISGLDWYEGGGGEIEVMFAVLLSLIG